MSSKIFIPEKINVGFQNREGTYTGKLAYIIYFDEKGKLRKEASWNSWRDDKIENIIAENVPTSGFVLNKKAGGYSTGWNHRQTYCRVYDPRGFEFEITIPNLLYILENTNSIKGKGLEGEFVYGWDGKDLILVPTGSPDYVELVEFNNLIKSKSKVKAKDLIIGGTYRTKGNEQYVYLGRFNKYDYYGKDTGLYYFFGRIGQYSYSKEEYLQLNIVKGLSSFIECVSSECAYNYAEMFDKLEMNTDYSPYDKSKDEYIPYTFEEFDKLLRDSNGSYRYGTNVRPKNYIGNNLPYIRYDKNKEQFYVTTKTLGGFYRSYNYTDDYIGNALDVFNKYEPVYVNQYLANGKLYRRLD